MAQLSCKPDYPAGQRRGPQRAEGDDSDASEAQTGRLVSHARTPLLAGAENMHMHVY